MGFFSKAKKALKSTFEGVTQPIANAVGWDNNLRDKLTAAATIAGNYYLPGSSLLTQNLVSTGAKNQLNTPLAQLATLGSGVAGGLNGNLSNYGSLADSTGLSTMFANPPGATPASATGLTSINDAGGGTNLFADGSIPGNAADLTSDQPFELSNMTATAPETKPAFTADTVAQGTNTATTPQMIGADLEQMPGNQPAFSALNAPLASSTPGFLQSLSNGNFGDAAAVGAGNVIDWAKENPIGATYAAGSLYDMYAKKQMAQQQQDLYAQNRNDIMNMYAPGSPEYIAMQKEMAAKDAAAGRNSQYGTRAADLAGSIAKWKANAIANMQTSQNSLANQGMNNQFGMFNTPLTLAMLSQQSKR